MEGPPELALIAEEDRMIAPDTQRFMAERMGARARTRPVDHTPQVTAPGEVVDIVLDAVRDVAAPQQQPVSNRPEGEAS